MEQNVRLIFPLTVLIAAFIAAFFPQIFIWAESLIVPLLGIAMFGMGLTLSPNDFKVVLKAPKIVITGLIAQYVIMSGLAYLIVKTFGLSPALAIGIILVGTCPGGVASNVMAYIGKGDVALSVSMTACSTLLSPLVTPVLTLMLAGKSLEINVIGMLFSILKIVILPVLLGMLCHRYAGKATRMAEKYIPLLSMSAITFIVGIVVALNAEKLQSVAIICIVAVITHNLLGLTLGYCTGKVFHYIPKQCRTLSFEIGLQNSGLAASLAKIHFAAMPEAMLPAAIFSVWHNISGALLAGFWASRPDKKISE